MASIYVDNISTQTSEKELRNLFSFCGEIRSLTLNPVAENLQSSTITFEKETAARSAVILNETLLGPTQLVVTSRDEHIEQEDKPRGRIIAECIAYGYHINDKAIEEALKLDQQHGISRSFTESLKKFKQQEIASEKPSVVWRGPGSYFDTDPSAPTSRKLRKFYERDNNQVFDVREEARHLVNLKKQQEAGMVHIPGTQRTKCNCHAITEMCPCPPGNCSCADCEKNPEADASKGMLSPQEAGMEKVSGTERTKCNCGATTEKCSCVPGQCACASCAKNPEL